MYDNEDTLGAMLVCVCMWKKKVSVGVGVWKDVGVGCSFHKRFTHAFSHC